ncbi:MAG TPA: FHA domain-containing protein [Gammaproteobacteria bacterium]|mgnify:CR=1 FL=1|nr:FHA domain-containing protein [Gammaproteobacteria bacterium]
MVFFTMFGALALIHIIFRGQTMIELLVEDKHGNVISHQLGEGRHTMGKSSSSDIILMDQYASRYHADIFVGKSSVFIIDAGSKNGVALNGKKITKTLKLECGDSFNIGDLKLTIGEARYKLFLKNGKDFTSAELGTEVCDAKGKNIEETISELLMG